MTQFQSAILFTIVRIALQVSSVFLLSHLASRTYNLTYLERINGGLLSRVNYIFFTEFSPSRKHGLGRLYVFLALVTTAFTFLSPLLNGLYPVKQEYLDTHLQTINPGTVLLQTTTVTPGSTNPENILSDMGFSLSGAKFHNYSQSLPPPNLCMVVKTQSVNCSGDIWDDFTARYEDRPVIIGDDNDGQTQEDLLIRNSTTPSGEFFQYFNASASRHGGAVVEAYHYLETSSIRGEDVAIYHYSPSLDSCLFRTTANRRCARHSLSYFVLKTRDLIGLISI